VNHSEKSADTKTGSLATLAGRVSLCLGSWGWLVISAFAVGTVVTFFARQHWIADLCANLRVQQVFAISLVLLLAVLIRKWWLAVTAGLLIAIHLPWFVNAFPSTGQKVASAEGITVTSVNVLSGNHEYDRIIADVLDHDPDVVAVIELTPELDVRLRLDLDKYPHAIALPQQFGNFGIGIYSKYPTSNLQVFQSVAEISSIAVTVAVQEQDSVVRNFRVFATHPLPPMNRSQFAQRNDQLRDVARRVKEHRQQLPGVPAMLVGDLNLTPWSPWFTELQSQSGLIRGINTFTLTPTWYRYSGFPFGLVLDHGLVDQSLVCTDYKVGPSIGSDHRSITIRLALSEPQSQ